jgi:two-component system, LytTR family, sensor kinase
MMKRRGWLKWGVIFGCWTLLSLIYSSHLYFFHLLRGERAVWIEGLIEAFDDFYVWAAFTPLTLYLAGRFPLGRARWPTSVLVHVPASLLISFVQVTLHTFLDAAFIDQDLSNYHVTRLFFTIFTRKFHFGLLIYWAILAINHAVEYYKDRELQTAQMEARLARAQLQSLRMQLHPHFLFNTLNAISALIGQDAQAADQMIARLSELLRMSLAADNAPEVTLKEELEFLNLYLEIEKVRFADRLTIKMTIDPLCLDAFVPNLILQPLVENSIRHGIARRRGRGQVEIAASVLQGQLCLRVRDNGAGFPADASDALKEGIGLANTRARLEQLYHEGHRFELVNRGEGGAEVLLEIPFRALAKGG